MNATWLLQLYPAPWRARYEAEFRALLEAQPATPLMALDIAFGALDAHLRPQRSPRPAGGAPIPPPPHPDDVAAARARVDALKLFWGHLALFLVVMAGLLVINLLATPGTWWVLYPLWGWGMLLAVHAGVTFPWRGFLGAHGALFVTANAGFLLMNWLGGGYPWSLWILATSGILLLAHALLAFDRVSLLGAHVVATALASAELLVIVRVTGEPLIDFLLTIGTLWVAVVAHAGLHSGWLTLYQAHLVAFVGIVGLLFLENRVAGDGEFWARYVLLGWGIVLAAHTFVAVRWLGFPDDDWERTRLERLAATQDASLAELTPRVRAQRELLTHAFGFGVVTLVLLALNLVTTPGTAWAAWPVGAGAVLLLAHLGSVVFRQRLFGAHLFGALGLALGLLAIDWFTGAGSWAIWPVLGLALSVLIHVPFAFGWGGAVNRWEEDRVATMLEQRGGDDASSSPPGLGRT